MDAKQVIVVRTDIKLPEGKDIAQIAHAVTAYLTRRISASGYNEKTGKHIVEPFEVSDAELAWINGIFTKVTLAVNSEEEILEIKRRADEANIECHLITDAGLTIYKGIPTVTCLGFAPMESEMVDSITGHLKLYKGPARSIVIGITGGIGSGKSTVCRTIGTEFLANVLYTDKAANSEMNKPYLQAQLRELFGDNIFDEKGLLDRPKLGAIVFNDKTKLEQLNALVHPNIVAYIKNWITHFDRVSGIYKDGSEFLLIESALMPHGNSKDTMDYIIHVTAPKEARIKRVMERNGHTREEVIARMESGPNDGEYKNCADYTIQNQDFSSTEEAEQNILTQFNRILLKIRARGLPKQ